MSNDFEPLPNPTVRPSAPLPGSTPQAAQAVDHLKMAQKAFEEWLRELDGTLQNSELAFDEYAGAIRNNDLEQAKDSMYRATQSLRMARLAIKAGLDAGV